MEHKSNQTTNITTPNIFLELKLRERRYKQLLKSVNGNRMELFKFLLVDAIVFMSMFVTWL